MKRSALTIVGLAVLAGVAIFVGQSFLKPAEERAQQKESVLTGAYAPVLDECRVLENHELPQGVRPPGVGEDLLYLSVVVLYPGAAEAPEAKTYMLTHVNGQPTDALAPLNVSTETTDDGTYVFILFQTDSSFDSGRLVHDGKAILQSVTLE